MLAQQAYDRIFAQDCSFFFTLYFSCTQKLLKRLKPEVVEAGCSTTKLGSWYATVLSWKQQIAMPVSEGTLLPVLMPLAPAATLTGQVPCGSGANFGRTRGFVFIHCVGNVAVTT